jgi:hypothetical protein
MDRNRRQATVRLFSPEDTIANYVNKYIICSLRRTPYGLQTESVSVASDDRVPLHPDVELAKAYILRAFSDDDETTAYIARWEFLSTAVSYVGKDSGEYGAELIRCAMELSLAHHMTNISGAIDVKLLKRAVFFSYGYIFTGAYSALIDVNVSNILYWSRSSLVKDKQLRHILSPTTEATLLEKSVLKDIKQTVQTLYAARQYGALLSDDKVWRA